MLIRSNQAKTLKDLQKSHAAYKHTKACTQAKTGTPEEGSSGRKKREETVLL